MYCPEHKLVILSFSVFLLNSELVTELESMTLNYFEPGHTFISADSLHHMVEKSLKQAGKVYDFDDFFKAVRSAKSGRNFVKEIKFTDFYNWSDQCSRAKLNNKKFNSEYPYLDNIKTMLIERGKYTIQYKNAHNDEEWKVMNFLKRPKKIIKISHNVKNHAEFLKIKRMIL